MRTTKLACVGGLIGVLIVLAVAPQAAQAQPQHGALPHLKDAEASHLPKVAPPVGGAADLDDLAWRGPRDAAGRPTSPAQAQPPLRARSGVTALSGLVLQLNGQPLGNVTLAIAGIETRTDRSGRFLLEGIPSGRQGLLMDGSTANSPGHTYGTFFTGVDLADGTTTVLPWTIWMPKLDTAHAVPLPVPTAGPMVITSPRIPGLEMHIPGNVILHTQDGPLRVVSLTRLSVDRPPFPVPAGATFLWTPQTHGALVVRPDGSLSPEGVRFILPNVDRFPAEARVGLQGYNILQGWHVYGYGTVSRDGSQIIPDPGVQFQQVTCIFLSAIQSWPAVVLGGDRGGDPVDVATGLYTMEKTDLVLPDVIPAVLQRLHRPGDPNLGNFGRGQSDLYSWMLTANQADYATLELILGDGARVRFQVTANPSGSLDTRVWTQLDSPTIWQGATVRYAGTAVDHWTITRRDGMQYEFSGHGGSYLLAIRDPRGNQLTIERQVTPPAPGDWVHYSRWPLRLISPNGRVIEFTVDTSVPGQERITQARDRGTGRTVSYGYDGSLRLTSVTDANGGVTSYTYDGTSQRLATITDPRMLTWLTNTYDANGRVTLQTFVDGTTWQYAYTLDANGQVTQTDVTNPRGFVERLTFDTAGYPLSSTPAFGTSLAQTTSYSRDTTTHRPTRITDALARHTDFTYDTAGNVLGITRLAGTANAVATTYTYTPTFNQLATMTDPLNHTTTFGYDGVANLTSIKNPLNETTTFTHDPQGNVLSVTDPLNQTTRFTYLQGLLYTITTPLGHTTTRFPDAGGRVVALTNPLGQRTRYAWDNLNQLKKITDPLGGETHFTYDGNGNLLTLTDARNNTTTYSHSSMDRVATRTDPLMHGESFDYDNTGNPTSHTDRKSQATSRTYDALDRLTRVTFHDGSTIDYTWDAGNRVTQLVDSLNGTITRAWDDLDRLTQESTPNGTISYTYDAADRRASMTVLGQPVLTYTFDDADRLTQIAQGGLTVGFAYDAAGRRTSLTSPNGVVTEYSYDAASRLIAQTFKHGVATLGTLTYGYDPSGRRTSTGGTWARTGLPSAVTSATYNTANQQTVFGGTAQTFDLNGNLTNDGATTYTWDARNQLAALSGGVSASFAYDGLARRRSQTIGVTQTRFHYDGLTPVQELDSAGGVVANLLTGRGIDDIFARTAGGVTRSHLTDILGSTVAELDSTGTTQAEYSYEPFGKTTLSGSSGNAFRYTGREDDGTGLYYYRARYYHTRGQRFISEDPIGFGGGNSNLYEYARNAPTRYSDPLGLTPFPGPVSTLDLLAMVLSGRKSSEQAPSPVVMSFAGVQILVVIAPVLAIAIEYCMRVGCPLPEITLPSISLSKQPNPEKHPWSQLPKAGDRRYVPPKQKGDPPVVRHPQLPGAIDIDGNRWEWAKDPHAGPHWDVHHPGGDHTNVAPDGTVRGPDRFPNKPR